MAVIKFAWNAFDASATVVGRTVDEIELRLNGRGPGRCRGSDWFGLDELGLMDFWSEIAGKALDAHIEALQVAAEARADRDRDDRLMGEVRRA